MISLRGSVQTEMINHGGPAGQYAPARLGALSTLTIRQYATGMRAFETQVKHRRVAKIWRNFHDG